MNIKWKSKKFVIRVLIALVVFFLIAGMSGNASEKEKLLSDKVKEVSSLEEELKEKDAQIKELEKKVEQAQPWFELSEAERQRKVQEEEARKAAEKAAAEKKAEEEAAKKAAAEAEAKKKAEAEAKKGYETGVTYDQLARTPDDYIGQKVKFRGKVVQVIEGDGNTQIRFAVNSDYDTILYGEFDSSIVGSRVLEDDIITIMGSSSGLLTYESTLGGNISIPGVIIEKIEQ